MRLPPTTQQLLNSSHVAEMPIVSNAVVYTQSFLFGNAEYFSLDYIATSGGTVGLLIELEEGNAVPETEGSVDDNWAVAENAQDIEFDLSVETQKIKKLSPVTAKYGRLKITGSGTNAATTTLNAKLVRQEEA